MEDFTKFPWGINFLIGKTRAPIIQPWEKELNTFKKEKPRLCIGFQYREPQYLKFKPTTADRIAVSIRPTLMAIFIAIAIMQILFFNYTSWFWWTTVVITTPWLVLFIVSTIRQIHFERRVKQHYDEIPDNIAVQVREGVPGAGKTSSLLNDMKILADLMWDNICEKYRMLEPYLEDIPYWKEKSREDAEEIIEAYNFYQDGGTYPCFWTSLPCFVDGIPTNRVTANHLLQKERLPYGSVLVLDETSLILPQELYRDKPYELIEVCKFPRHFGDFKIGSTEQDEDSNLIYLRRVSGQTMSMLEQEWIQQPKILQWIYDKLLNKTKTMTKKKVNFFKMFNQLIHAMGYRRYWYIERTLGVGGNSGIQSFILKPNLNITYDDRSYKNAYKCKDKPLIQSKWEHLRLTKEEIDAIFPQELKDRGKTKEQIKREAIERKKNKIKLKKEG